MADLDLDAARAARAEHADISKTIKFGGKTWTLPAELPGEIPMMMLEGRVSQRVFDLLLGDQHAAFFALVPSSEDLIALIEALPKLYPGLGLGKSNGSAASSPAGGRNSKRTSNASTRSTSAKPSTRRRR